MILALAVGCSEAIGDGESADPADYAGPDGRRIELVGAPVDSGGPDGTSRWLEIGAGTWTLREGAVFASAETIATWETRLDLGFSVDGVALLPATVKEGEEAEGVSVVGIGPLTTWYGEFPDVARVAVAGGTFAGEAAFARDVGPVTLTLDGVAWELATYQ